jgi:hypothetical protein
MGWPAARAVSGEHWLAPFLAETLNDPYHVVRYIAGRSLRSLAGFATPPAHWTAQPLNVYASSATTARCC